MKKTMVLSLLFVFMISTSVQALSWAYSFVVWKSKVYEVKQEEIVAPSDIGKVIGKVKTKPDGMTGSYYGNASNHYPRGTKYYEIKGTSTSTEIAVKEDKQWVKAVYIHKAPFHILNIFSNKFFLFGIVMIGLIVSGVVFRMNKSENHRTSNGRKDELR